MEKRYASFQWHTFLHCANGDLERQRHYCNSRWQPLACATAASNYDFFTTKRANRRNAYRALPDYALPLGSARFHVCNKDQIVHETTEALPKLIGSYYYAASIGAEQIPAGHCLHSAEANRHRSLFS